MSVEALLDPGVIVQLGVAPVRVDVLSSFATVTFREAWQKRHDAAFGRVPAHYLGREHLIAEKLHFDRPQDRADIAALRAVPRPTKRLRAVIEKPPAPPPRAKKRGAPR